MALLPLLGALEGGGTAAGQGDTGRVREAGRHTRVGREEGRGRRRRGQTRPEATQARAARPQTAGREAGPRYPRGLRQAPRGKAACLPPAPPLGSGDLRLTRRNGVHEHQHFPVRLQPDLSLILTVFSKSGICHQTLTECLAWGAGQ